MKKSAWLGAVLIAPIILLAACSPAAPATPTTEPNAIYTAAAATVVFQLTRAAALVPSPTDTVEPTAITAQITETPTTPAFPTLAGPSLSDQPTLTGPSNQSGIPTLDLSVPSYQTPTTSSSGQSVGDAALFQYQVPADNTTFTPNQQFQMAWGIKNNGAFTWTTGYTFRWLGGAQMSGVTRLKFNKAVKPGEKIEFDLSFEAPAKPGKYITYWAVYNASGLEVAKEVYLAFNVSD
jgi:Ig-like domain from next to BRCA1 gene